MTKPTLYAYLGGSFDPIHFGHLQMIGAVANTLANAKHNGLIGDFCTELVPTKANPFKANQTPTAHRLAMLNLAIGDNKLLKINRLEIDNPSDSPSYTIDTLQTLTAKQPNDYHNWIMGLDSLLDLPKWKNGLLINNLANLWVFPRNVKDNLTDLLAQLPSEISDNISFNINDLYNKPTGVIFIDSTPILDISSTIIRNAFKNHTDMDNFLPQTVADYAKSQHLYD